MSTARFSFLYFFYKDIFLRLLIFKSRITKLPEDKKKIAAQKFRKNASQETPQLNVSLMSNTSNYIFF